MDGPAHLLSYLSNYFPILVFIGVAFAFGAGTLVLSHLLQRGQDDPRIPVLLMDARDLDEIQRRFVLPRQSHSSAPFFQA